MLKDSKIDKSFVFYSLLVFLFFPFTILKGSSIILSTLPVTDAENTGSSLILWSKDIYHIITILLFIIICIFLIYFIRIKKENIYKRKAILAGAAFSDSNILYTLIDSLPEFIYIKDDESKFVLANKKLAQKLGRKSGIELVGKADSDLYPKELAKEYLKKEQDIMKSDIPIFNKREKGIPENGKETWVSISIIPLHDKGNKVIGLVGLWRDITEIVEKENEIEKSNSSLLELNAVLQKQKAEMLQQKDSLRNTAEKLYQEEKQLRTLIDNMPDRIYIKDRQSRFIVGNMHVANIMGVNSSDELIGKTDFDFYPKDLAQEFFYDEQKLMDAGLPIINKEERGLDMNGHEIIVSTTKVPFKNENGEVIGVVGMGRDITPQKLVEKTLILHQENLQEANTLLEERQEEIQQQTEELHAQADYLTQMNQDLEKLSMVASHTDNVVIIMDADANIEYRNKGFEKHYGSGERKSGTKVNLRDISSNENIVSIIEEIQRTKKSVSYEGKSRDKDSNEFWSQTTITPVLNEQGDIVKLIAIDSDISKLKDAELEMSLQKEVIEKNRDDLKRLNETKNKFFSIIAHDLKNPFHSIMGFSELLTRSFETIEDARKKEFLQLIKDSSTSAYNLLENLLDWSRTQTNSINFTPANINIAQILNENIQIHSVVSQNKEIKISHSFPERIISFADANMINTVVRNLLSNALKFTPKGGEIRIEAGIVDNEIFVSIKDSGLGMDETARKKLFKIDEFHNSVGTSGETGTGLGLIICQEFISRNGGKIIVESEPGKGSSFKFSLPLEKLTN